MFRKQGLSEKFALTRYVQFEGKGRNQRKCFSFYFTVSDQVRRSRGEDDRAAALLPGGGQTGLERLALPCDHASCCSHWGHPGRHHHLPFTHSQRSVCLSTNSCPWVPQSQFLKPGMGKCNSVVAYNVSCEFNMQQQWAMTTE